MILGVPVTMYRTLPLPHHHTGWSAITRHSLGTRHRLGMELVVPYLPDITPEQPISDILLE